TVTYMGDAYSWSSFLAAFQGPLNVQKTLKGAGIRVLTQTVSSPTLADQMRQFLKLYPEAKWHVYEPVNRDNALAGAQMAFGQPIETQYKLENADVIVSLDADFLYAGFPGFTRYAREYAKHRNPDGNMNRLYVVESTPSSTGVKADHRLPMRAIDIDGFARALASAVGTNGVNAGNSAASIEPSKFIAAIARDLQGHRGASVVIPGEHQPASVHALAHAMN